MTDEPMMITWPSDDLARRLATYALALSPTEDVSERLRGRVLAAAADRLVTPGAYVPATPPAVTPARSIWRSWAGRRAAAAGLAAALAIVAFTGVAAAAQAGGPLYASRLWVEALTLPTEPAARLAADVRRLDARLSEARAAFAAGNAEAAGAALDAYGAALDDTIAAAGADPDRDAVVTAAVGQHLSVLTALVGRVPTGAENALESILSRTDGALDRLRPAGRPSGEPGGNGNGNPAAGQPSPPGAGGGAGNSGGQGPGNDKSQGPQSTPRGGQSEPPPTDSPDAHAKPTNPPPAHGPSPTATAPGGGNDQGGGGNDQGGDGDSGQTGSTSRDHETASTRTSPGH